jgi:hypothetical protein
VIGGDTSGFDSAIAAAIADLDKDQDDKDDKDDGNSED